MRNLLMAILIFTLYQSYGQTPDEAKFLKDTYSKIDTMITMRDGVRLYTSIYIPKDQSATYPFLIERTPYSIAPYGKENYTQRLGPTQLVHDKYIFVLQDVRGRYMSEGLNLEVTPFIANKVTNKDVDESSDTYDTVDWLVKNISNNNGRAGFYGISYPGFYANMALLAMHPAIRAVSPQAPVVNEFVGDDANHNGAFYLLDNFNFMNFFGKERTGPVQNYGGFMFLNNYKDAYQFFLDLGPVKNTQAKEYFNNRSYIWNEYLQHYTYDDYWKARDVRPYLNNISIPTLVVGGWFDAEDLWGALHTYEAISTQGKNNNAHLVMGPWTHGAWAGPQWSQFGTHDFGSNTSKYFQDSLQTTFFNYYLKDKGNFNASAATLFETGSNRWRNFSTWPPPNTSSQIYFLKNDGLLSISDDKQIGFDEYISDPKKPVPYTNGIFQGRNNEYMVEDQRFAAIRPDVLVYTSEVLPNDLTVAGKAYSDLFVSTSSTDADFIIKLIDVLPDTTSTPRSMPRGIVMAGFQRLVRAEVMRGKFRNSLTNPQPFVPGQISEVNLELNDVLHTFKKGHKIMVQIQSSWFPLVDLNPQKFLSIPSANASDFQKATIKIYHDPGHYSSVALPVLK